MPGFVLTRSGTYQQLILYLVCFRSVMILDSQIIILTDQSFLQHINDFKNLICRRQ